MLLAYFMSRLFYMTYISQRAFVVYFTSLFGRHKDLVGCLLKDIFYSTCFWH